MRKHKVGDHVLLKLSGGRIVEATIKAIVETTEVCACRCPLETGPHEFMNGRS